MGSGACNSVAGSCIGTPPGSFQRCSCNNGSNLEEVGLNLFSWNSASSTNYGMAIRHMFFVLRLNLIII